MKESMVFLAILLLVSAATADTYNLTNAGYYSNAGFTVNNLKQTPDRIYPGDQVHLTFDLQDNVPGGSLNVQLTALAPFLPAQTYYMGQISQGQSKPAVIDFILNPTTKPGNYEIFLYVLDEYGTQAQVGNIPILVNEEQKANVLVATINSAGDANAGDSKEIIATIENTGDVAVTDVLVQIQYSSTSSVIPVGTDRIHLPQIEAKGSAEAKFTVGISASAPPAFYPITLVTNYNIDKVPQAAITQTAALKVLSKTFLLITSGGTVASSDSTGGSSLAITVANTGDTAVRSVYAIASSDDYTVTGIPDQFIGTLNQDDSSSMSVTIVPKRAANPVNPSAEPGAGFQQSGGKVNIKVTYKDALNIEHTQIQQIPVSMSASGFTGTTGIGSTQRFGRQQTGFRIFGIDWWIIVGAAVLLIAAFFGYKWMKRRSK
ncbi:MAG: hypothetical protein V1835_02405 [Candidatus Micrarchaeota archaeon]